MSNNTTNLSPLAIHLLLTHCSSLHTLKLRNCSTLTTLLLDEQDKVRPSIVVDGHSTSIANSPTPERSANINNINNNNNNDKEISTTAVTILIQPEKQQQQHQEQQEPSKEEETSAKVPTTTSSSSSLSYVAAWPANIYDEWSGCPSLTHLDLAECKQLRMSLPSSTDRLFKGLPNLLHLYLPSHFNSFSSVLTWCTKLLTLNIDDNTYVSDEVMLEVARSLPSLTSLSISNCTKLTDITLNYLYGQGNHMS